MAQAVAGERRYLYAILAAGSGLPEALTGLNGRPVRLAGYRDLAAAISAIDLETLTASAEQVWRHEQVIERLMAGQGVLPVRFGTVLSSDGQVEAVLSEHYDVLKGDLERLAGQVELGLRVFWTPGEAGRPPVDEQEPACVQEAAGATTGERPGTRYMLSRLREKAQRDRREQAAREVELWCRQRLAAHAGDVAVRLLATERLPVSAAILVRRERMHGLIAAVEEMQHEASPKGWQIVCTGPWPPYHFITRF